MVNKRKFNEIKEKHPESRIGKRTREEQQSRNRLAVALKDAIKNGLDIGFSSSVAKEKDRKVVDPTKKLRELAIDVDESISKLPFEEVEKMVNDDNLKKCLLFVNGIAALLNGRWKYCEDNLLNEEYKDKLENDRVAVEKFIEENPLLQERVPWFVEMLYNYFVVIEKAYNCSTKEELRSFFNSREYIANSRLSIKRKVWLAYNDLLQPLIKLVFDQRDLPEAAKKYFAEYVAQCGLFPYDYDVEKEKILMDTPNDNTIIKYFGNYRIPLHSETWDSYSKEWKDGVDREDLTKFLRLFGVGYISEFADGDVHINFMFGKNIPGSHFENITVLQRDKWEKMKDTWAGKGALGISDDKLHELEHADLVIIYRDNDTYSDMRETLEKLVKTKYGGKVYCVSIDKTIHSLDEDEINELKRILSTCPCITDNTVSNWTGVETKKIDKLLSEELGEYQKNFIDMAENIENYCIEKGIDTVYLISDGQLREGYYISLLEHGGFCQREDGTIYYVDCGGGDDLKTIQKYKEDSKRFWKSMFPNINVEFVQGNIYSDGYTTKGDFKYSKSKGALAIADRHFSRCLKNFQQNGGKTILFAGYGFESEGGIKGFSDSNDGKRKSHGEKMAESIFSGK